MISSYTGYAALSVCTAQYNNVDKKRSLQIGQVEFLKKYPSPDNSNFNGMHSDPSK